MLGLVACGEPRTGADSSGLSVTDSAGVVLVRNGVDLVRNPPSLVLREELRIGGVEGSAEEQFFQLIDVAVGEQGEIYTLDAGARVVRVLSADGRVRSVFGRPGEGPGEFPMEPLRLAVGHDTVVVQDRAWFHLFLRNGEPIRRVQQRVTGNEGVAVLVRGPSGWIVGRRHFSQGPPQGQMVVQDSFRISHLDLTEGALTSHIIEEPSVRRQYLPDGRSREQWMGARATGTVTSTGEVYVARGDEYEIRVYSLDGQLLRIVRADVDRAPLTRREMEEALEREIQAYSDPRFAFGIDQARALGPPEHKPIVGNLLASPDGWILLQRVDLASPREDQRGSEVWDLLDAEGRIVGQFEGLPNSRFLLFDHTRVYAVERDDLDVQSLVRYRIMQADSSEFR